VLSGALRKRLFCPKELWTERYDKSNAWKRGSGVHVVVLLVRLCCVCRYKSRLNVPVTVREGLEKAEGKTEDMTEKGDIRYSS